MLTEEEERIATCGHLERFWKVEVNQDAWCLQCAIEKLAINNSNLRNQLNLVEVERNGLLRAGLRLDKQLKIAIDALIWGTNRSEALAKIEKIERNI